MKAKTGQPGSISSIEAVWEAEKVLDLALDKRCQAVDEVKAARFRVKAARQGCKLARKTADEAKQQLVLARKAFRKAKAKHKKRMKKSAGRGCPPGSIVPTILAEAAKAGTPKPRRRRKPAAGA